jgi:hypothetical protein
MAPWWANAAGALPFTAKGITCRADAGASAPS